MECFLNVAFLNFSFYIYNDIIICSKSLKFRYSFLNNISFILNITINCNKTKFNNAQKKKTKQSCTSRPNRNNPTPSTITDTLQFFIKIFQETILLCFRHIRMNILLNQKDVACHTYELLKNIINFQFYC